ncbi:hypothetical protein B0O99DRAFT_273788 [Bisporella sp. PMI_857]|nr:hypothetical protein B0O99DRAFT_273788 [Bisporella sp. PMI_857]
MLVLPSAASFRGILDSSIFTILLVIHCIITTSQFILIPVLIMGSESKQDLEDELKEAEAELQISIFRLREARMEAYDQEKNVRRLHRKFRKACRTSFPRLHQDTRSFPLALWDSRFDECTKKLTNDEDPSGEALDREYWGVIAKLHLFYAELASGSNEIMEALKKKSFGREEMADCFVTHVPLNTFCQKLREQHGSERKALARWLEALDMMGKAAEAVTEARQAGVDSHQGSEPGLIPSLTSILAAEGMEFGPGASEASTDISLVGSLANAELSHEQNLQSEEQHSPTQDTTPGQADSLTLGSRSPGSPATPPPLTSNKSLDALNRQVYQNGKTRKGKGQWGASNPDGKRPRKQVSYKTASSPDDTDDEQESSDEDDVSVYEENSDSDNNNVPKGLRRRGKNGYKRDST